MDPYDQIRAAIPEISTFELQERSGMFCEYLRDAMKGEPIQFPEDRFECILEEPYSVSYHWDFGTFWVDVGILAGEGNSYWKVTYERSGKRCWSKRRMSDVGESAKELVSEIRERLG